MEKTDVFQYETNVFYTLGLFHDYFKFRTVTKNHFKLTVAKTKKMQFSWKYRNSWCKPSSSSDEVQLLTFKFVFVNCDWVDDIPIFKETSTLDFNISTFDFRRKINSMRFNQNEHCFPMQWKRHTIGCHCKCTRIVLLRRKRKRPLRNSKFWPKSMACWPIQANGHCTMNKGSSKMTAKVMSTGWKCGANFSNQSQQRTLKISIKIISVSFFLMQQRLIQRQLNGHCPFSS